MSNGKRGNWMSYYQGDRPRDVLGLTEDQEATLKGVIGFVGKNYDGDIQEQFILIFEGTSAPTVTDYAECPIGTLILTPKLADIFGYQKQADSTPAVIGDWAKVAKTTVS